MSELIFKNFKPRCSSIGHIMTNLPVPLTEEEEKELADLQKEKTEGVNANGNKTKWTDTKQNRVNSLLKKQKGEDELPEGAKTHLDDVFRSVFWKRRRHLTNKFLDKGLLCEQDILALKSKLDNEFYIKNDEHFNNAYIQGSWDSFLQKVIDTKANYDLKTFEEADLSQLYGWQLKGYSFIAKEHYKLDNYPESELVYGLVNSPLHHITNEFTREFYANGNPDDDDENWIEVKRQVERNHIFDRDLFLRDYPAYQFQNKIWEFDIPWKFRIKQFDVKTTEDDVDHIKRRVLMSRVYLCEKEIAIYNSIKEQ